jgi:hypothetical protein
LALVHMPLNSEAASGTIETTTYLHRGRRTFTRPLLHHDYTLTTARAAQQAALRDGVTVWHNLSDAERQAWRDYAQTLPHTNTWGEPTRLTGFNLFLRRFTLTRKIGSGYQSLPYLPDETPNFTGAIVLKSNPWHQYELILTPEYSGGQIGCLDVWRQGPISNGRKPRLDQARSFRLGPPYSTDIDVGDTFTGHYGYWARWIRQDYGDTTPWLFADLVVP